MLRLLSLASSLLLMPALAVAQPSIPPATTPPIDPATAAEPSPETQTADTDRDTDAAIATDPVNAPAAPVAPAPPPPVPAAALVSPPSAIAPPGSVAAAPLAPVVIATAPPAEPIGLERVRTEDAASHRAYVLGTAVTLPRGRVTLDIQQPVAPGGNLGLTVGVADRLQLGASVLWVAIPEDSDGGAILTASAKLQLLRGRTAAVALHTTWFAVPGEDDGGYLGLIGSACIDGSRCRLLASLHGTAVFGVGSDDQVEVPIVAGGSLLAGDSRVKFLAEVHVVGDDDDHGVGGFLGVRIPRPRLSFDGGFVFGAADGDVEVVPLPFFGLSSRY